MEKNPTSRFVYVIYIRSTPEKVWQALTTPEFTRQYWTGTWQESAWSIGATWKLMLPDGRIGDSGNIVAANPYTHLELTCRNEFVPEMKAEGYSLLAYDLDIVGDSVKLTVVHVMDMPNSKLIAAMSALWPHLLSSMKTLLETGTPLEETRH